MNEEQFVTRSGHTLRLVAIPAQKVFELRKKVRRDFEKRGEPMSPPTYQVKMFTGGFETFAHDVKSLKTDEDRAAWLAYKDAISRFEQEQAKQTSGYILARGVMVEDADIEAWAEQQMAWGFDVSKDAQQRKLEYLEDILADHRDLYDLTAAVFRLSLQGTVTEDAIDAAEAMFRREVEGREAA